MPPADEEDLKLGRGNSSCKECLPLQLTIGTLLNYLRRRGPEEITVYMMPSAGGPCRFGQYNVFARKIISKQRIPNVAVLSPTSLNGYGGLGDRVTLAAWRNIVIADLFEEMYATILAGASDVQGALEVLHREHGKILALGDQAWSILSAQLSRSAQALGQIGLHTPYERIPKISLIGEIYVRHDPISRQGIIERLGERGFIVRTAQVSEWLKYTDWLIRTRIEGQRTPGFWIRYLVKRYFDRRVRQKLAPSGLFDRHTPEIQDLVEAGRRYVSPQLTGEAILTVGASFHEILSPACGIISIGPFGCMPSRLAEAILSEKFTTAELRRHSRNGLGAHPLLKKDRRLPFFRLSAYH